MKLILLLWLTQISYLAVSQNNTNGGKYSETYKIEYLIQCVEKLDSASFIRNGVAYTAKDAAAHLSMKREKAGKSIKTADDFIQLLASKSSMSGKPYVIKYSNGKEIFSEDFFKKCLSELSSRTK